MPFKLGLKANLDLVVSHLASLPRETTGLFIKKNPAIAPASSDAAAFAPPPTMDRHEREDDWIDEVQHRQDFVLDEVRSPGPGGRSLESDRRSTFVLRFVCGAELSFLGSKQSLSGMVDAEPDVVYRRAHVATEFVTSARFESLVRGVYWGLIGSLDSNLKDFAFLGCLERLHVRGRTWEGGVRERAGESGRPGRRHVGCFSTRCPQGTALGRLVLAVFILDVTFRVRGPEWRSARRSRRRVSPGQPTLRVPQIRAGDF